MMDANEENDKQSKTMNIHTIGDYRPMGGAAGYNTMGITAVCLCRPVCGPPHGAACFSQPSLQAHTSALTGFHDGPRVSHLPSALHEPRDASGRT